MTYVVLRCTSWHTCIAGRSKGNLKFIEIKIHMALLNVILIQQVSHEDYHDVFFLSVFQMLTIGLVNPYPPTSCSNQRKADSRVTLFYKKSKAKTGNVIFPFQKAQNHCCSSKIVESIRFFNCGFCLYRLL